MLANSAFGFTLWKVRGQGRSYKSGVRPAKREARPRDSSMRNASFHFAMRSEREKEPTLS